MKIHLLTYAIAKLAKELTSPWFWFGPGSWGLQVRFQFYTFSARRFLVPFRSFQSVSSSVRSVRF